MGGAAGVVEEDDGGVFLALVGGGDPIPGAKAGGGEAEAGTEFVFEGQFVEGFDVQGLKTIDLPRFGPPMLLAGFFQLEAGFLNGGAVFVQLQKSFREEFAQFAFDGFGLGIEQTAQVVLVDGLEMFGGRSGTESCDRPPNACGDDEQGGGEN